MTAVSVFAQQRIEREFGFLSIIKIMSFEVVVIPDVVHQILLETIMVAQHIFVHQIDVMGLVQKMYLLMQQVSDLIHE